MSARAWRRVHGWATVAFTLLWVVAVPTRWIYSIAFISNISMLALVYAALACWQGSRTEVKQDENGSG